MSAADYLATSPGELLGKGYEHLDVSNMTPRDVFECLAHNLDPQTGQKLRPRAKEGERVGMDFTFNSTKSVGIARELAGPENRGDPRIEEAHREAVAFAMKLVERDVLTQVKGGRQPDRQVANLMAYRVTHRDTRINADDNKPDMSLHDHVFVLNTVYDPTEKKWKAAQLGQIKHDAPYYEAVYHNRLASNLRKLGYGIRRKDKAFEIEGISDDLVKKFSRRTETINKVVKKLGIKSPEGKAKIGATSRMGKSKETEANLNAYYVSRLTEKEKRALQTLQGRPSYECSHEKAAGYAIAHCFERRSVLGQERPRKLGVRAYENGMYTLMEEALRHGMGSVDLELLIAELERQGVLVKGNEVSTRKVLEQEGRIIDFAREGKGTMRPLSSVEPVHGRSDTATLSAEQQAFVRHFLTRPDKFMLGIGDAGTGKTRSFRVLVPTLEAAGYRVAKLAPSVDASRLKLREDFPDANTVAAFRRDKRWQSQTDVALVDEATFMSIDDAEWLCNWASGGNRRLIVVGDPKQHKAVVRHGNLFEVLQEYAGLPAARLAETHRFKNPAVKEAAKDFAQGKFASGLNVLDKEGWVCHVESDQVCKAVADQWFAMRDRGVNPVVVGITHDQIEQITSVIRNRLKERGELGQDDVMVDRFKPLAFTEAQALDAASYSGSEAIQFRRNIGPYRAGQVLESRAVRPCLANLRPSQFSAFTKSKIGIAAGDSIRITFPCRDVTKKHNLDTGAQHVVESVSPSGDIRLQNGYKINTPHLRHNWLKTSFNVQGRTDPAVITVMTKAAGQGVYAGQSYVDLTRGANEARVITDMTNEELVKRMQRKDERKSATEVFRKKKPKLLDWQRRARDLQRRRLYLEENRATPAKQPERSFTHER